MSAVDSAVEQYQLWQLADPVGVAEAPARAESIGALLYVYWVPLTAAPIRAADGNPRFR